MVKKSIMSNITVFQSIQDLVGPDFNRTEPIKNNPSILKIFNQFVHLNNQSHK